MYAKGTIPGRQVDFRRSRGFMAEPITARLLLWTTRSPLTFGVVVSVSERASVCVCVCTHMSLSRIRLFVTPRTAAHQAPLSHFPGKNTGVGGCSLLHTAVGQMKSRSVSGRGEEGGRLRGWEEQGELGE